MGKPYVCCETTLAEVHIKSEWYQRVCDKETDDEIALAMGITIFNILLFRVTTTENKKEMKWSLEHGVCKIWCAVTTTYEATSDGHIMFQQYFHNNAQEQILHLCRP